MFEWILNKFTSLLFRLRFDLIIDTFRHHDDYVRLERLKKECKYAGKNIRIQSRYIIKNPQYLSIGDGFFAMYNLRIEAWDEYAGTSFSPEIIIGKNVAINTDVHIGCIQKVVIGDNVLMASRIYISDHSHGEINAAALSLAPAQRPLISSGPVIIEDNVWIGEGVCIMPNVRIGKNAIIGANAVVTRDVPPDSVAAGIPARVIKSLI